MNKDFLYVKWKSDLTSHWNVYYYWLLTIRNSVFLDQYIEKVYIAGMKISHLNALRAVEATLRNGNFRIAAQELGVTPAAVSQRVASLENYIGRKLFTRSPKGAEPNVLAKKYAATLTTSLKSLSEVLEGLTESQSGKRLSLTMTQTFAESWLLPRLSSFYRIGTEIDFRIDTTDREVDLRTEDVDYGIRFAAPLSEEYDDIELFKGYAFPLCTPEVAERFNLSPKTQSLKEVPLIHIEDPTTDPEWIDWPGWAQRFNLGKQGMERGLRFSQIGFGMQAAIAGRGVVLCGATDAPDALLSGRLVNPFGRDYVVKLSYSHRLVSLRDRNKSGLQLSFESWMQAEAQTFRESVDNIIWRQ